MAVVRNFGFPEPADGDGRNHGFSEYADEDDLVRSAKTGSREAFSEIYRRHRDSVLRLALARLPDPTAAEEVVQDTFLRAFLALERLEEAKPLGPWLATIAANRIVDIYRRQRTFPTDPGNEILARSDADTTLEAVLAAEGVRNLKHVIRDLPARWRRILVASVLEEISPAELAEIENISESSVTSVIYRARLAVRRALRRLTTVVIGLRLARRRLKAQLDQAEILGTRASFWAESLASACCWSVALALTVALGIGGATYRSGILENAAAVRAYSNSRNPSEEASPPILGASRTVAARKSGEGAPAQPVQATTHIGPARSGAAAPYSGKSTITVYSPLDYSQPLLSNDGGIECSNEPPDIVPNSIPVRIC